MRGEQWAHTLVAVAIIVGVFTMLIISQVTRVPLQTDTLTIISGGLGSALGWFFGSRSTVAGGQMASDAVNRNTQTLTDSAMMETQNPRVVVDANHATATPEE